MATNVAARPAEPRRKAPPSELKLEAADDVEPGWVRRLRDPAISGVVSLVCHAGLMLVLALCYFAAPRPELLPGLDVSTTDGDEQPLAQLQPLDVGVPTAPNTPAVTIESALASSVVSGHFDLSALETVTSLPTDSVSALDVNLATDISALAREFAKLTVGTSGALEGRSSAQSRGKLLAAAGGSPETEDAVRRALGWLAAHQLEDGSWHFDHTSASCPGLCRNPGMHASTTGATAISLLAFLGNGHTHLVGEHKDVVKKGLYYLTSRMITTPEGGDFREGTMYAHGLAAIALCEAFAMTKDRSLEPYAQAAINYIGVAQHEKGGWRYDPLEPGDTTVTGWQVMALKSAQMAYLRLPKGSMEKAIKFLDSVEFDRGAQYRYMPHRKTNPTLSSIGLLLRMYTGWEKTHPGLKQGIKLLDRHGPHRDNMYFNYYATQVMHHWGDDEWIRWNYALKEILLATQEREGHESGSWFCNGGLGVVGGRLYNTALGALTLEVYYRHLPIYGTDAVDDNFQEE